MQCCGLSSSFIAVGEHESVKKIRTKEINPAGMYGNRCFLCSLPRDVLPLVLGKLTILDYLSFRAVCRCWRRTFLQCQDLFQHRSQEHLPCVVFLKVHKYDWVEPILHTTGKLGHSLTRRVYNLNIPDFDGARFLLSKYGWLLLFSTTSDSPSRSSLFFLNPFSGSRIDLPFLDVPSLNWPQFCISSPPTSRDCIICVMSVRSKQCLNDDLFIDILHYGDDAWSWSSYPCRHFRGSAPFNVAFNGGTFYCIHKDGELSAYSTLKGSWKHLTRPRFLVTRDSDLTTFVVEYYRMVFFCLGIVHCLMFGETKTILEPRSLVLGQIERILEARSLIVGETERIMEARATLVLDTFNLCSWLGNCEFARHGGKSIMEARETMILDSFNVCSWFGDCDFTEDGTKFNWCGLKRLPRLRHTDEGGTTIAWLEPRWIHPTLNLRWGA